MGAGFRNFVNNSLITKIQATKNGNQRQLHPQFVADESIFREHLRHLLVPVSEVDRRDTIVRLFCLSQCLSLPSL
jgi:hypothetical protein